VPMVQVAAGTPQRQVVVELPWRRGLTAAQAVAESGVLTEFPELAKATLVYGRFGVRIDGSLTLRPGDRVELCRPLRKDPRDMRREALSTGGFMGQG